MSQFAPKGTDALKITAEDHARISEAIRLVENKTSGEVYAVMAHQSDDYFYVAGFMAALWSLLLGLVIAVGGFWFGYNLQAMALVCAQLVSLCLTLAIFHWFPSLRLMFVPKAISYRRASNNALRQFMAHGIHTTSDRSGVLLFVSLAEHYAEVVADAGISQKVEQADWDALVDILIRNAAKGNVADGFVTAVEQAGVLLATHFPPDGKVHNELDDRLVEI